MFINGDRHVLGPAVPAFVKVSVILGYQIDIVEDNTVRLEGNFSQFDTDVEKFGSVEQISSILKKY